MRNNHKYLNVFLLCTLFIVAFRFSSEGVTWFWKGMELVPIILGVLSIIFGTLWMRNYLKRNINGE